MDVGGGEVDVGEGEGRELDVGKGEGEEVEDECWRFNWS